MCVCVRVCDKGAVEMLILSKGSTVTKMSNDVNMTTQKASTLKLIEGRPSAVRCVAVGGYPSPVLDLFVGMRDVTGLFLSRYAA